MMFCDCKACEYSKTCEHRGKYERLPREYYPGALSLCPKLKFVKEKTAENGNSQTVQRKNISN